jgi:hypothetical protein
MEMLIFVVFVGLEYLAKQLPHWVDAHPRVLVWIERLGQHHWAVWVLHPAVLHGAHEYLVHFIVYSGYVFGGH